MKIRDYEYYINLFVSHNFCWVTNNNKILMLCNEYKDSIAHEFAYWSTPSDWLTDNIKILRAKNKNKYPVALDLAFYHCSWTTTNKKILMLKSNEGTTVKDYLIKWEKYEN